MRRLQLALAVVVGLAAHTAVAHTFEPALLDLQEGAPGVFTVTWRPPGPESGARLPGDAELLPALPESCRQVAAPALGDGEAPIRWQVDCGATGLRGQPIAMPGLDGGRVDVVVRLTWRDGATLSGVLRSGASTLLVPGALIASGTPALAVSGTYFRLGAAHVLGGVDSLLCVLALLLLAPVWGMRFKAISAFTVAHSLTLALAGLGVVHVPAAPVAALIALSILLLARELTRPADAPPTLTRQRPWVVAFICGLLHGFGFAGALAAIGLPADQTGLGLLSFNLGVEAGQWLFVIAVVGPIAWLMRATPARPRLRLVPAYAIGALAAAWVFQRVQHFWM